MPEQAQDRDTGMTLESRADATIAVLVANGLVSDADANQLRALLVTEGAATRFADLVDAHGPQEAIARFLGKAAWQNMWDTPQSKPVLNRWETARQCVHDGDRVRCSHCGFRACQECRQTGHCLLCRRALPIEAQS